MQESKTDFLLKHIEFLFIRAGICPRCGEEMSISRLYGSDTITGYRYYCPRCHYHTLISDSYIIRESARYRRIIEKGED